ncbi:MAG: YiiX/YebB-like N1pC/P60 family cysteine hydrolase [Desulforhopalus sp.]
MKILQKIGQSLARRLSAPKKHTVQVATSSRENLQRSLQPGDVLLVDGSSTFSIAIKYLTQSSWSHAALFVGNRLPIVERNREQPVLIEADVNDGVRSVGLSLYAPLHTRICRPIGLNQDEITKVIDYVVDRLGYKYDLRNIIDLARYLLPTPLVPLRFRRRFLALGSGDPTLAICSSLIAQAFQSIKYPILPDIEVQRSNDPSCIQCHKEILHIRHHSLFTPRDFDVSPYFQIVKPTLECGFDPHTVPWSDHSFIR